MMKNELFSSLHGNKTKIMEMDPNIASDSVFLGGWGKNERIEEMKEKLPPQGWNFSEERFWKP